MSGPERARPASRAPFRALASAGLALLCSVTAAGPVSAQRPGCALAPRPGLPCALTGAEPWAWRTAPAPPYSGPPGTLLPREPTAGALTPVLLSLGVPGLGQLSLERPRGWGYLALETLGWALYLERRGAGADFRDRYRDLAWSEAREQSGPRVDGGFDYYETLSQWLRSGSYDGDPGAAGLQPESDPTTFNGMIWARAKGLFLPGGGPAAEADPSYQSALRYYRDRAYPDGFLWDWTGTGSAQADFTDLIARSDERFRQATNVVGAVIANHVISAVDAYLTARGVATPVEVRVAPEPRGARARWSGRLSLPLGS